MSGSVLRGLSNGIQWSSPVHSVPAQSLPSASQGQQTCKEPCATVYTHTHIYNNNDNNIIIIIIFIAVFVIKSAVVVVVVINNYSKRVFWHLEYYQGRGRCDISLNLWLNLADNTCLVHIWQKPNLITVLLDIVSQETTKNACWKVNQPAIILFLCVHDACMMPFHPWI